jgi:hypothetical protein
MVPKTPDMAKRAIFDTSDLQRQHPVWRQKQLFSQYKSSAIHIRAAFANLVLGN